MTPASKKIAAMLLRIGAVKLSPQKPFTWASGWLSPIYCDNRLALSYPEVRNFVKQQLVEVAQAHFPQTEVVAGVATAGIAQGALLADALQLPFAYVRSKPKEHGLANMIEGRVVPGQKVLVVEDLISTGGSSLKVVEALRQAGAEVVGMLAIFTYGFAIAEKQFAEAGVKLITLSNYTNLVAEAVEEDLIGETDIQSLYNWRAQPDTWGR
jgi:orotate phosphoribosyltransferase